MRRLRDLPGVMDLERRARVNPALATDMARWRYDEIDDLSNSLFGVTVSDLLDATHELPEDAPCNWETEAEEAKAFAEQGWDVTDENGRPLLILKHLNWQLSLVLARKIAFRPGVLEGAGVEAWSEQLTAAAARWQRSKR